MKIIAYDNLKHSASIAKWLHRHGRGLKTQLPKHSYIVPGVAAIGLRIIEGNLGMIDSLVTNKLVSGPLRNKAIEALVKRAEAQAFALRLTALIAFSTDDNTIKRAFSHGYAQQGHLILTKELR